MSRYDKSAAYKIDKIIKESARSKSRQPKATAVSISDGHYTNTVIEMQGE